jgi:hypothetical protein
VEPAVHPKHYVFVAPIDIPTIRGGSRGGFFDVASDDGPTHRLYWRSLEDWPVVVRQSTGERARLVKTIMNDVQTLPRQGRVTLTFEQCLCSEGNELVDWWDEEDWQVQEDAELSSR